MSKLRRLFLSFRPRYLLSSAKVTTMVKHPAAALKELGYAFNDKGELKKLKEDGSVSSEPYQFKISKLDHECQEFYEKIGSVVTDYVYCLLETQENMMRLPVPKDADPETGTFIFASKEYDSKDVLLILIHGSGAVRAGQWARSLIINENLDKGTQIPYIKRAASKNYGILVLNTNDNCRASKISKSSTPDEHAQYVWDKYVTKSKARSVVIVAHSYGGVVAMSLAKKYKGDFKKRVKGVAMTDSVHGYSCKSIPDYVREIARNWVSSEKPLDTPVKGPEQDIPMVSAGHPKHEMTSYSCMDSVFKFFEEKLAD